jgi:DNA glycosylase AlkZ-like
MDLFAGSTSPYLAIRARIPTCSRSDLDRAVFDDESIVEVPTMRASMLAPAEDRPLAIRFVSESYRARFKKVSAACRLEERELADLARAITTILKAGPRTSDELRGNLPPHLVRSLGPEGKQFGESSLLSFVLRHLWTEGALHRFSLNRQLDSSRHSYRLAAKSSQLQRTAKDAMREMARRFFHWAAPATLKEFAWWVGSSQKDARGGMEGLELKPVSVTGWASEAWIDEEQLDSLVPQNGALRGRGFIFLPFRDNYLYFRRGLAPFLAAAAQKRRVLDSNNKKVALGELDSLHHNAIVLQGRLVGLWEYDPEEERMVWSTLEDMSAATARVLAIAIEELEDFIRAELGDVRLYSIGTGARRRDRINSVKSA